MNFQVRKWAKSNSWKMKKKGKEHFPKHKKLHTENISYEVDMDVGKIQRKLKLWIKEKKKNKYNFQIP